MLFWIIFCLKSVTKYSKSCELFNQWNYLNHIIFLQKHLNFIYFYIINLSFVNNISLNERNSIYLNYFHYIINWFYYFFLNSNYFSFKLKFLFYLKTIKFIWAYYFFCTISEGTLEGPMKLFSLTLSFRLLIFTDFILSCFEFDPSLTAVETLCYCYNNSFNYLVKRCYYLSLTNIESNLELVWNFEILEKST